jgi:hypothetical protein
MSNQNDMVLLNMRLHRYRSFPNFIYVDYEDWKLKRLNFIRQVAVRDVLRKNLARIMEDLWVTDSKLQQKFFRKVEAIPYDDKGSISDECQNEKYNNSYSNAVHHQYNNPIPILGLVIKEKDMHYELFKILSKNKLRKLKNLLIHKKDDFNN